jgi:hypothetical protein
MADFGPLELLVIVFPENKFHGTIVPEFRALMDAGTIRIVDLVFVTKDADGNVDGFELSEVDDDLRSAFDAITSGLTSLIRDEDVADISDALDPNSAAAVLIIEHLWSTQTGGCHRRGRRRAVVLDPHPARSRRAGARGLTHERQCHGITPTRTRARGHGCPHRRRRRHGHRCLRASGPPSAGQIPAGRTASVRATAVRAAAGPGCCAQRR